MTQQHTLDFTGRVAIVTGAGGGLGGAISSAKRSLVETKYFS